MDITFNHLAKSCVYHYLPQKRNHYSTPFPCPKIRSRISLKKNALIITFVLVGLFLLMPMLSTASAAPTSYKANATGVGAFVHDHDGIPHTHYFVFSISSNSKTAPQGQFSLVCTHDGQIARSFSAQKSAVLALNLFKEDLRQSSPGQHSQDGRC